MPACRPREVEKTSQRLFEPCSAAGSTDGGQISYFPGSMTCFHPKGQPDPQQGRI